MCVCIYIYREIEREREREVNICAHIPLIYERKYTLFTQSLAYSNILEVKLAISESFSPGRRNLFKKNTLFYFS